MGVAEVPTGTWVDEWAWSVRHRLAAELDESAPSPELVSRLVELEPADLDDAALVEVAAAWERTASWAAAAQARAVQELFRRREHRSDDGVADELAARLSCTRAAADDKLALALRLDRLPEVADALARGEVDVRRATVLTEDLAHLPEALARDVAVDALPRAKQCTAPQLRRHLRRLELVRDPAAAELRREVARRERRVQLVPALDSMAWLSALLPAEDAVAVYTTLSALADQPVAGDERSADERRADALVDVVTRHLDDGTAPDGTPLVTRQGRRPHLVVTASPLTLMGLGDAPGELEGYGPVPAGVVREIAARATWEPLLVDARTGEPLARSSRRYEPTKALREGVVLRDRTCRFPGCRVPANRCDVDHIEPFVRGAGGGDAQRGAGTGAGDGTEARAPDQTRLDNLQALCRHHHRLKTHEGWTCLRAPTGDTIWLSPSGRPYRQRPEHPPPDRPPPVDPPDGLTIDYHPPPP